MKSPSQSITLLVIFLAGILLAGSSCTSRKKLLYLQDTQVHDTMQVGIDTFTYRFQVRDHVYISIKGLDDQAAGPVATDPAASLQGEAAIYLNSYTIDDSGFVTLPLIGNIHLLGLTIDEARTSIQAEVSKYLLNPWVNVKLAYFQFTVLGEVNEPGVYRVYDSEINLLEAVAFAGDLTEYGNRQQVMILREGPDGQTITHLDISDASVLRSPHYNLRPNDIIYVQPYPAKSYGLPGNTLMSGFTTFASVVSTLVSLYLLSGVLKSS